MLQIRFGLFKFFTCIFILCCLLRQTGCSFSFEAEELDKLQSIPLPLVAFSTHYRPTRCLKSESSSYVPKGNNWIFESLSSLLLASSGYWELPDIHLVVGGDTSSYLDNLKHHKNIHIHPLSEAEVDIFWSPRVEGRVRGNWKGGYNYVRCLNLTNSHSTRTGVLVAEDDVVFTNDFWLKFNKIRYQIEQDFPGEDYILDCYLKHVLSIRTPLPKRNYGEYSTRSFCCTQLMYFTHGAAQTVMEKILVELTGRTKLGYDISIKHAYLEGLRMFGARPALVQHIGVESSIGSSLHRTHNGFEAENAHLRYDGYKITYTENATRIMEGNSEETLQMKLYHQTIESTHGKSYAVQTRHTKPSSTSLQRLYKELKQSIHPGDPRLNRRNRRFWSNKA